jgi:hypothetical protein
MLAQAWLAHSIFTTGLGLLYGHNLGYCHAEPFAALEGRLRSASSAFKGEIRSEAMNDKILPTGSIALRGIPPPSGGIQHRTHLARKCRGGKRLLQERHSFIQPPVMHNRIVGVAGHEQDSQARILHD